MRTIALSVGLLALFAGDTFSQWGGRGCPPPSRSGSIARSPYAQVGIRAAVREWRQVPQDPGRYHLFVNGHQAGGFCTIEGVYRVLGPKGWEPPSRPPEDLPAAARAAVQRCQCCQGCSCDVCRCADAGPCTDACTCPLRVDTGGGGDYGEVIVQNFGIELNKLDTPAPRDCYRINGRPASRSEVFQALTEGQLSDDSKKRRVTVIGSKTDCDRALEAMPAELKQKYLVQAYRPDNFAVARTGFKTDGSPSVYFQEPPDPKTGLGRVLWREDAYTASTWENVRKADPDYRPDRDPGPHQPKPPPGPAPGPPTPVLPASGNSLPMLALAALGALALAVLGRQPQPQP